MQPPSAAINWIADEILPHEPAVRSSLLRLGANAGDLDDILQETYCRLSEIGNVEEIRSPRSYFHAAARSVLLQRLRRERVVVFKPLPQADLFDPTDNAPSAERTISARLTLKLVMQTIAGLPAHYREVVELRRLEGLSQKETASRLGISEKIVENNLARGLKAVLKVMEEHEILPEMATQDTAADSAAQTRQRHVVSH